MINRCQAGIASILLATGDFGGALQILRTTNSYGPTALALMRAGEQGEASQDLEEAAHLDQPQGPGEPGRHDGDEGRGISEVE